MFREKKKSVQKLLKNIGEIDRCKTLCGKEGTTNFAYREVTDKLYVMKNFGDLLIQLQPKLFSPPSTLPFFERKEKFSRHLVSKTFFSSTQSVCNFRPNKCN